MKRRKRALSGPDGKDRVLERQRAPTFHQDFHRCRKLSDDDGWVLQQAVETVVAASEQHQPVGSVSL